MWPPGVWSSEAYIIHGAFLSWLMVVDLHAGNMWLHIQWVGHWELQPCGDSRYFNTLTKAVWSCWGTTSAQRIQVWLYIMNKVTNTKTIQNDMYTVYMYTGCKISEWGVCMCVRLIQQAWFVGGHHVFDVYKRVISAVDLKRLQCLLNQVTNVLPLLLAVVNPITRVHWSRGRERRKIVSMNYTKQYKDEGTSYQKFI